MKTVSQSKAAELVKAGWVKETYWKHVELWDAKNKVPKWVTVCPDDLDELFQAHPWLPAPTADEIAEVVSYRDLWQYWITTTPNVNIQSYSFMRDFSEWLYTTRNSADLMAEVFKWKLLKGSK
jgi:hypothetical protein